VLRFGYNGCMTNLEELENRVSEIEKVQREGIKVLKFWVVILLVLIAVSFFV